MTDVIADDCHADGITPTGRPGRKQPNDGKIVVLSGYDPHDAIDAINTFGHGAECIALTQNLRRRGTLVLSVFALVWAFAGGSGLSVVGRGP